MGTHTYKVYATYTPLSKYYGYYGWTQNAYKLNSSTSWTDPMTGTVTFDFTELYEVVGTSNINSLESIKINWVAWASSSGSKYSPGLNGTINGVALSDRGFETSVISLVDNKVTYNISYLPTKPQDTVAGVDIDDWATLDYSSGKANGTVSLHLSSCYAIVTYDGNPPPSKEAKAEIYIDSEMRPMGKIWIGDSTNTPRLAKKIWMGTSAGNKLVWPPQTLGNQDLGSLIYLKESGTTYTAWRIVDRNIYHVDEEGTRMSYTTVLMRETLITGAQFSTSTSKSYYRGQAYDNKINSFYNSSITNALLQELIQPVYILSATNKPATTSTIDSSYSSISLTPDRILRYCFAPSAYELKGLGSEALEGKRFAYFEGKENSSLIRKYGSSAQAYLTRSPVGGGDTAYRINTSGGYNTYSVTGSGYYGCPCICLSNDLAVTAYSDGYKLAIQ